MGDGEFLSHLTEDDRVRPRASRTAQARSGTLASVRGRGRRIRGTDPGTGRSEADPHVDRRPRDRDRGARRGCDPRRAVRHRRWRTECVRDDARRRATHRRAVHRVQRTARLACFDRPRAPRPCSRNECEEARIRRWSSGLSTRSPACCRRLVEFADAQTPASGDEVVALRAVHTAGHRVALRSVPGSRGQGAQVTTDTRVDRRPREDHHGASI